MPRRRIADAPLSRLAVWARRCAFFSLAATIISIVIVRSGFLEIVPALATFAGALVFAGFSIMLALGAFAALRQNNIKRLMAYSSIGNVGYVLLGLASGTEKGIQSVVFYLAIYMVMTLGVFAVILLMKRKEIMVEEVSDLSGLGRSHPMMALAMLIFMFSMAGIPPLFGFWAKFLVFDAAVAANLTALAAFGIAMSVIGAFYYLKIIKTIYFDEPAAPYEAKGGAVENIIMAACAIVIVFGYLLNPLLDKASAAAAASRSTMFSTAPWRRCPSPGAGR